MHPILTEALIFLRTLNHNAVFFPLKSAVLIFKLQGVINELILLNLTGSAHK